MKIQHPLVSIGMPLRNSEKFAEQAINCMLAQTHENFELIIFDNASEDATAEICQRYVASDPRVRYFKLDTRVEAGENFANVARHAKGDYFMWAAADDLWAPEFVEALVGELKTHPKAGLAMSAIDKRTVNGELIETVRYTGQNAVNDRSYLWVAMKMATADTPYHYLIYGLYRSALLLEAIDTGFLDVPTFDRIFMMQIALSTQIRYVDKVLHTRTIHEDAPHVRHAEEKFIRDFVNDHLLFTCSWLVVESYLWSSKTIPDHRKPLASMLSACYADSYQAILYRKTIEDDNYPLAKEINDDVRSELAVTDELSSIGAHAIAHKLVSALALANPNSPEVLMKLAQIKIKIGHQKTADKILKNIGHRWPQLGVKNG